MFADMKLFCLHLDVTSVFLGFWCLRLLQSLGCTTYIDSDCSDLSSSIVCCFLAIRFDRRVHRHTLAFGCLLGPSYFKSQVWTHSECIELSCPVQSVCMYAHMCSSSSYGLRMWVSIVIIVVVVFVLFSEFS